MEDVIFSPISQAESVAGRQERKPEAVVLGNGPSLRGFDFDRLSRFDVFGMNAAYRYWFEIGWFPQYYSCLDLVVGASHRDAIFELIRDSDLLGIRAFLLRRTVIEDLGELADSPKVFNFDLLRPGFEAWIPGPVTTGSHTCAWASILGYKDIYLLGIDCNYVEVVPNAELREGILEIVDDAPNPNYFFDSYQKKGDKYNIPNPRKDLHLDGWRNVGEKLAGRSRVLNANFVSKVDKFPFVSFDDVERGGHVPVFPPFQVLIGAPLGSDAFFVDIPSCDSLPSESILPGRTDPEKPWSEGEGRNLLQLNSTVGYDAEWNTAGETERHAFAQAFKLLPAVPGVQYFGFPWSTLIGLLQSNPAEAERLLAVLAQTKPLLEPQGNVITVCQHIDLLKYRHIFSEAGITHLFWTHADCSTESRAIKIYPFPFSALQVPVGGSPAGEEKNHLYSFIESKGEGSSTPDSSGLIFRNLAKDRRGVVIARHQWDFGNLVRGPIVPRGDVGRQRADESVQIEAWRFLLRNIFSLCPASPGVNSQRLWESIGCGAIPVLFNEPSCLPGSKALWEEATVFCPERQEDIKALPDRLEALTRDEALLARKRHALRQLRLLYGSDCFIYDIQKLFLSLAQESSAMSIERPGPSYGRLLTMAASINHGEILSGSEVDHFILGCNSRLLSDPSGFQSRFEENAELRMAYKRAIVSCNQKYSEAMRRSLEFRGIALN